MVRCAMLHAPYRGVTFRAETYYNVVMPSGPSGHHEFATTRWSIVVSAGRDSSADSRDALATLCEAYWIPLYGYVRRRVGSAAEAADLTQAFFAELLEKNFVGAADPERGRFRAFLLTSLKHFLSKQRDRANAQKRGGGRTPLSLNFEHADSQIRIDPEGGLTPEQVFDRDWALTLLGQILERLKSEFDQAGKSALFTELKPFLVGEQSGVTWAQAAERLNMSEAAAKMAGTRMRRRYRELLREEIAQTVAAPQDVDDEIRNLFNTLGL